MPFSFLNPDRRFRPAGQIDLSMLGRSVGSGFRQSMTPLSNMSEWFERRWPQTNIDIIRSITQPDEATPVAAETLATTNVPPGIIPFGSEKTSESPRHFPSFISPPSPRQGRPSVYQDFFHQCLTADEIQSVLNDIDIEFQPGSGAEHLVKNRKLIGPVNCSITDENGLSTLAATIKIFQLMKWLPFDSPIPIMGNPYNWMKNARSFFTGTKFRIFRNIAAANMASAFEIDLVLYQKMDEFSVVSLAESTAHEMRHTMPGGAKIHTCNSEFTRSAKGGHDDLSNLSQFWRNDQDLGDGACAFSYWFMVWCRHHVQPDIWSDEILKLLDSRIDFMWKTYFCYRFGQSDPAKSAPPPIDPLTVYPNGITYWNDQGRAVPWMAGAGDPLFGEIARNEPARTGAAYGVPMAPYGLDAWWLYPERRNAVAAQWGTPWEIIRGSVLTI